MASNLLPSNATAWERAAADVMDRTSDLVPSINLIRGTKITTPLPSFLPYLVYEYGLGELTPYVPNIYNLINEGIHWQRLRGTHKAMEMGLGWLSYTAAVEEEDWERIYWNMFQLELDRIRDTREDLVSITGLARLSAPMRSVFWRGYHGLDIRPLTFSKSSWSESHYGEYSGVRIEPQGPLWSFGRRHEREFFLTLEDLDTTGDWVHPVDYMDTGSLSWTDITWDSTQATWGANAENTRILAMSSTFLHHVIWIALIDPDGDVIGYRRARTQKWVQTEGDGPYEVNSARYGVTSTPSRRMYIEAQTDFGNGEGREVAEYGLAVDIVHNEPTKPGKMWLEPEDVVDEVDIIARSPVSVTLGESIRERFIMIARFDIDPLPAGNPLLYKNQVVYHKGKLVYKDGV